MRRIFVVVALLGLVAASCSSEPEELSGIVRTPLPSVADIVLPDAGNGGAPFQMVAPEDELLLVYFGYTSCPDICPATLADMRKVMEQLGDDAGKITFAMETVDIERDTDEIIYQYVQSFIPSAHGLRAPDEATLRAAADVFGANYEVTENDNGGLDVLHTAHVYAVNDEGLLLVTWAFGTEPETMVKDIRLLLTEA